MSMEPTTFTVIELKEQLRVMGLPTAETNTELIARLTETDPARELLEKLTKCRQGGTYEVTNTDEDALGALGAQGEEPSERNEWIRRFELLEKEVLLLRLENEALRQRRALASEIRVTEVPTQRHTPVQSETRGEYTSAIASNFLNHQMNIQVVVDLLRTYAGELGECDKWEKQLQLLRETFRINDEQTKILPGMQLKGKALEWLHSKSDHMSMPVQLLLSELREMFSHRPIVLTLKCLKKERGSEARHFVSTYMIKLSWQIKPTDDREIVSYLLQGIPDPQLRDQARLLKLIII